MYELFYKRRPIAMRLLLLLLPSVPNGLCSSRSGVEVVCQLLPTSTSAQPRSTSVACMCRCNSSGELYTYPPPCVFELCIRSIIELVPKSTECYWDVN